MPRVDFYIIADATPQGHYHFACRIIDKAYQCGHKVLVNCGSQEELITFDELLWTYKDISFIPHNILGEGPQQPPPVQLGRNQQPAWTVEILLNLATQPPDFHQRCNRIIEITSQYQPIRQLAREHYKLYRSCGYALTTHDLTTTQKNQ